MKKGKIVLLILVLILAVATIIVVSMPEKLAALFTGGAAETETDADPSVYELNELSIELTPDFNTHSAKSGPSYKVLISGSYTVTLERTAKSSITPKEGYPFPSLVEFMQMYLSSFALGDSEKIAFLTDDHLLCADADTDGDGQPDTLIAIFESKDAFWNVRMNSSKESYESTRAQFLTWAKSVRIEGAVDSQTTVTTAETSAETVAETVTE